MNRRRNKKMSNIQLATLILKCKKLKNYTPMQNTDLYNKNSVCYCILLETISDYNIPV